MATKPSSKRVAPKAVTKKTGTRSKAANKTAQKSALKPLAKTTRKPKAEKKYKDKLIRDSFTMPEAEYVVLAQLKQSCIDAGFKIKKSELLRIGISQLARMGSRKLKTAQAKLTPVKAGRPKKNK